MPWHVNIPRAENQVRDSSTASGDLTKMRENFALLSGVALSGISGLQGVSIPAPNAGESLVFDGALWIASGISGGTGGGSTTLSGLTDTNIDEPMDGQLLTWDSTPGEWKNQDPAVQNIGDLGDVSTGFAADGEILIRRAGTWQPPTDEPPRFGSLRLRFCGTPQSSDDAATKGYVDTFALLISGATLASGSTQGAAGAGAGEIWVDTDDQTLKMGV